MGRQVNFYMTEHDEAEFLDFVRSDRDVCGIPETLPSEDIVCLPQLPEREETPFWFTVSFWDRDHSPPPRVQLIREQGYWVVDQFDSEVIEFSRSIMDQERLVRGRIWAEMAVWQSTDPPTLVRKSESFQKWFDRLARWVRNHGARDENGDYVLPGAAEYEKQGGQLVQAVFATDVKTFHHEL